MLLGFGGKTETWAGGCCSSGTIANGAEEDAMVSRVLNPTKLSALSKLLKMLIDNAIKI